MPGAARRVPGALLALLLLAACATVGGAGPGSSPGSAREERVLVTAFADVYGVAVSQRTVFVVGAAGLGMYDRAFHVWLPPVSVGVGFPDDRITIVAADPAADAVWLGGTGAVYRYEPTIDLWTRAGIGGRVERIVFDRRDPGAGALVRAGGAWSRVSAAGGVTPLFATQLPSSDDIIVPIGLEQLTREFPSLRTMAPVLTRDDALRSWPISAGSRGADRLSEVWLGTLGGGVFEVDPAFNRSRQRPYGLAEPGVGALARGDDGVWIASPGDAGRPPGIMAAGTLASRPRGTLTHASEDLRHWRWLEPGPSSALGGGRLGGVRTVALLPRDGVLWLATDRGLAWIDTAARGDSRLLTTADGLPDDRVLSLAATGDLMVAGTERGAIVVNAARREVGGTLLEGRPVPALLADGDSVWLGSAAGLFVLSRAGSGSGPRRVAARAVRALARSDSLLVVATPDELLRVTPTGLVTPFPALDVRASGLVTALAVDAASVVVGGSLGALVIERPAGAARLIRTPLPVRAVLLTSDFVWLGTDEGLLRLRRLGGLVP